MKKVVFGFLIFLSIVCGSIAIYIEWFAGPEVWFNGHTSGLYNASLTFAYFFAIVAGLILLAEAFPEFFRGVLLLIFMGGITFGICVYVPSYMFDDNRPGKWLAAIYLITIPPIWLVHMVNCSLMDRSLGRRFQRSLIIMMTRLLQIGYHRKNGDITIHI